MKDVFLAPLFRVKRSLPEKFDSFCSLRWRRFNLHSRTRLEAAQRFIVNDDDMRFKLSGVG